MAEITERLVLVPRFTTLGATGVFYFKPINVRAYYAANVTAWRGRPRGTSVDLTIDMQASYDLVNWDDWGGSLDPSADDEQTELLTIDREWLRVRVTITGSDSVANTIWVVGEFTAREN